MKRGSSLLQRSKEFSHDDTVQEPVRPRRRGRRFDRALPCRRRARRVDHRRPACRRPGLRRAVRGAGGAALVAGRRGTGGEHLDCDRSRPCAHACLRPATSCVEDRRRHAGGRRVPCPHRGAAAGGRPVRRTGAHRSDGGDRGGAGQNRERRCSGRARRVARPRRRPAADDARHAGFSSGSGGARRLSGDGQRPRDERLDLRGAGGGVDAGRPLHGGDRCLLRIVRPAARRRARSGARHARRHRHTRADRAVGRRRSGPGPAADGLRPSHLSRQGPARRRAEAGGRDARHGPVGAEMASGSPPPSKPMPAPRSPGPSRTARSTPMSSSSPPSCSMRWASRAARSRRSSRWRGRSAGSPMRANSTAPAGCCGRPPSIPERCRPEPSQAKEGEAECSASRMRGLNPARRPLGADRPWSAKCLRAGCPPCRRSGRG